MNIQEIIDYRKKCFVCQTEMIIYLSLGKSITTKFSLQNNIFEVNSQFCNLKINSTTGQIIGDDTISLAFANNPNLLISSTCIHRHHRYCSYSSPSKEINSIYFPSPNEDLIIDNFYLSLSKEYSYFKVFSFKNKDVVQDNCPKNITIPWIDLSKTTSEKLINKFKTCIIFS